MASIDRSILAALLKNYLRYDFVVMNPPYIEFKRGDASVTERLRRSYTTARGKFDYYIPFIQRGIDWLNENGNLGLICSSMFLKREYGDAMREYILKKCSVRQIIDFGDSAVFEDVVNYPCIMLMSKRKRKDNKITCVLVPRSAPKNAKLFDHIRMHQLSGYSDQYIEVFTESQNNLSKKAWNLIPSKRKEIFTKIQEKSNCVLGDLCKQIYEGIATANDKVFFVSTNTVRKYDLESHLLKRLLKGKDVKKWHTSWKSIWVIYPYKVDENGRNKIISKDELCSSSPNTYAYFLEKTGSDAFGLHRPRNPSWFEAQKLLVPEISRGNAFAYDDENFYVNTKIYGIVLEQNSQNGYFFVLGLLNSKVCEFYYKLISVPKAGGFYAYKTQFLKQIPIKTPTSSEDRDLSDQIVRKVRLIILQAHQKNLVESSLLDCTLEYRSKGAEFEAVDRTFASNHDKLKPLLSEVADRGYVVYPSDGESPIWINTKEKALYVALTLEGKSVKKEEPLKILVPMENSGN